MSDELIAKSETIAEPCCGNCKFRQALDLENSLCRRMPPSPLATPHGIVGAHALVTVKGWCGEHVRKVDA